MTPPKPPPPPPPHHNHAWMVNEEREWVLSELAGIIELVGSKLKENGYVKLNDYEVRPPSIIDGMVRYERMPHGDLKLKIEMTWVDGVDPGQEEEGPKDLIVG
jgi:hypothetical protein